MQPFQERVIIEKLDLDEKLNKLGMFMRQKTFQSCPKQSRGSCEGNTN